MTEKRQKQPPMTNEEWKVITGKWAKWIKKNPKWQAEYDELLSIPSFIKRGTKTPAKRRRLATAIRTCFNMAEVPDTPFTHGKVTTLPEKADDTRTDELKGLHAALKKMWDACEQAQRYLVKSKRGGGGVFADGDEFADYMCDTSLRANMGTYHNAFVAKDKDVDYWWDGTASALINNIPDIKKRAEAKKAKAKKAAVKEDG